MILRIIVYALGVDDIKTDRPRFKEWVILRLIVHALGVDDIKTDPPRLRSG